MTGVNDDFQEIQTSNIEQQLRDKTMKLFMNSKQKLTTSKHFMYVEG